MAPKHKRPRYAEPEISSSPESHADPASASDSDFTPARRAAKRSRPSTTRRGIHAEPSPSIASSPEQGERMTGGTLNRTDLQAMSKPALIAQYLALQTQLQEAKLQVSSGPHKIEEEARRVRSMMLEGIPKVMTWKPSCKEDNARFNYKSIVSTPEVFYNVFHITLAARVKRDGTSKNTFTFGIAEFQQDVLGLDEVVKYARYSALYFTGRQITVRWMSEENAFTVGGKYGTREPPKLSPRLFVRAPSIDSDDA